MGGAEIRISDPVVSFRETIGDKADHVCMSKSPNKHNRCVSTLVSVRPFARHSALMYSMVPCCGTLSDLSSAVRP